LARSSVDTWYKKGENYVYGRSDTKEYSQLSFTQVVWKSSQYLGCAKATSSNGWTYVVCDYDPPGNYVGLFKENVLPPVSTAPAPAPGPAPAPAGSGTRIRGITTTTEAPPTPDVDHDKFELQCLQAHNFYRQRHGAPLLELSPTLTVAAKELAVNVSKSGKIVYPGVDHPYGTNLFQEWVGSGVHVTGWDCVEDWYKGHKGYQYDKEPTTDEQLSFSQLVWINSRYLGCAVAKSSSGWAYLVAQYDPPGNYAGQFIDNVKPPTGSLYVESIDWKIDSQSQIKS